MTLKIVDCLSMSTIRRRCVTMTAVCVHVHMSDNREPLCDAVLHVDVSDNRRSVYEEKIYSIAFPCER